VVEGDRYVRAGKWKTWGLTLLLGSDIAGACLGIVGFGRIGQAVAKRAQGFGMEVLFYDPGQRESQLAERLGASYAELDDLLGRADFVSLHTPLTAETQHFIGARELGLMKADAILINTARGPVVDPAALYEALKAGKIGGAALDVTDPEPIPPDDPLLELDNLILAPHIASASRATRGKMAEMAVENLAAGLAGERLPNCVNPEVYG
jgi:glyoxylate reductase